MRAITLPLLWKWSLRDLRQRWMQVVGISVIIALGVAVFSGLGSATPWRTKQLDESYAILNMFDLKMMLTPGSYLEADELAEAISAIPHADWIEDVDWRLSFPTSVDASTPDRSVLVSGQVIGVNVSNGGPVVNKLHVSAGRALEPADAGEPVCLVEHNFATFYDLEPGDRSIRLSGGYTLEPVGNSISAEHFMVIEEGSGILGIMAQERFVALFLPLDTAQEIAGLPGMVNEGLMTVVEGLGEADLDLLKTEIEDTVEGAFPQVGLELEKVSENRLYRMLYDDIPGDQQMYDTFASILLLGAAFGSFILIGRIVDAQRREIGINMALGVPPMRIARRYLLVGAQIAFLGMVLGVLLGLLLNQPFGNMIGEFLPTPYFESPFQPGVFARGALIGMVIPFLAIIHPIWRAVRVPPVDAIQTGYLVSKGGGLAPLMARLPLRRLPGSSFTQLPLRNLSRGLRRTLMTVLGLAMAIIVLIAIIGMIDTINETLDTSSREIKQDAPNRTLVLFDDLYPLSDAPVADFFANDKVAQVVPGVYLPGQVVGDEKFEVFIHLMDLDNDLWSPTIVKGGIHSNGEMPGILINEKAARDLGVSVGDSVTLRHPYRESQRAWRLASTPVQVVGIHPDVLRTAVYMDIEDAGVMNLEGVVNTLHLDPAAGVGIDDLRQDLSPIRGVAAVRRASAIADSLRDFLEDFMAVFVVVELVVLVMVFLIAFNTTRSNIDERRRELATMFAFGTPVRTVLRMAMVENFVIGALGTAVGIGLGWLVLNTALMARFDEMMPELNPVMSVSSFTLGLAVLFGVVAVAMTPLTMARRLARMDIPDTLRVVE
jgi:putative ABC transport system permease protein